MLITAGSESSELLHLGNGRVSAIPTSNDAHMSIWHVGTPFLNKESTDSLIHLVELRFCTSILISLNLTLRFMHVKTTYRCGRYTPLCCAAKKGKYDILAYLLSLTGVSPEGVEIEEVTIYATILCTYWVSTQTSICVQIYTTQTPLPKRVIHYLLPISNLNFQLPTYVLTHTLCL